MITLGIETSCDECACGIVNDKMEVLANAIYTQDTLHAAYGGVVPEIAARAHLEKISPVVQDALREADLPLEKIDLIAYTRGPGLVGALLVGASFAQGLGASTGIPVTGVSHLEGHLAAAFLSEKNLQPPFICLTVSGGHTELCLVTPDYQTQFLGATRDDAAGEAFDKCGKILGLGYPSGPRVSKLAVSGDRSFLQLPLGMNKKGNFEFSFSGLKTAFHTEIKKLEADYIQNHLPDICASLESAIVEILVKKSIAAAKLHGCKWIAVCGGVSANPHLRERMLETCERHRIALAIPNASLCTDNGAMIAGAAQSRYNRGNLKYETKVEPGLRWG